MQTAVEVYHRGKFLVRDYYYLGINCTHLNNSSDPIANIRCKYPNKIPIFLERSSKERRLPDLERKRFLVPLDLTLAHFQAIIRKRLKVSPTEAFFFLINNKTIVSLTQLMQQIYAEFKSEDNYLHIAYLSQDSFGGATAPR